MHHPASVKIVEVGPRDGLQNESVRVPTETKIELIDRLSATGLQAIEATAFVSPKWVPQMADHSEVMRRIARRDGVSYPVLVPNMRGFETARQAGITEIAVFAAATEAFSRKNINCSIAESLQRFAPLMEAARASDIQVRGYVSCVLGCPYEGEVDAQRVADIARQLYDQGCYEISLGDTIGVGTPATARATFAAAAEAVPVEHLAGHFHDTYGQALANILAAMDLGVSVFDSSVGGLGGCPYANGATGNVATEDVLYMLHGMGIETGVALDAVIDTGRFICDAIGRPSASRVSMAKRSN